MKHTVVYQEWEESERGWGIRPDGFSLHLGQGDRISYLSALRDWEKETFGYDSNNVPEEYSRHSGEPKLIEVNDATYAKLLKQSNSLVAYQRPYQRYGLRFWKTSELADLQKED